MLQCMRSDILYTWSGKAVPASTRSADIRWPSPSESPPFWQRPPRRLQAGKQALARDLLKQDLAAVLNVCVAAGPPPGVPQDDAQLSVVHVTAEMAPVAKASLPHTSLRCVSCLTCGSDCVPSGGRIGRCGDRPRQGMPSARPRRESHPALLRVPPAARSGRPAGRAPLPLSQGGCSWCHTPVLTLAHQSAGLSIWSLTEIDQTPADREPA